MIERLGCWLLGRVFVSEQPEACASAQTQSRNSYNDHGQQNKTDDQSSV
jgi:hypothetical protein